MDFIHPHLSLILFGLLLYKVIRDQSRFIYRRGGGGGRGGGGFGGGKRVGGFRRDHMVLRGNGRGISRRQMIIERGYRKLIANYLLIRRAHKILQRLMRIR